MTQRIRSAPVKYVRNILIVLITFYFNVLCSSLVSHGAQEHAQGDLTGNGQIDVRDVVLVNRYILEKEDLTEEQLKAAYENADVVIDVRDSILIMHFALGLIDYFIEEGEKFEFF